MFTLPKLLALAAILGIVWYGFKLVGRLDEARKRKVADRESGRDSGSSGRRPGRGDQGRGDQGHGSRGEPAPQAVVDLVQDESGAYVARDKRDDRT